MAFFQLSVAAAAAATVILLMGSKGTLISSHFIINGYYVVDGMQQFKNTLI